MSVLDISVSQPVYDDYTKRIIEGFKEWSGEYTIQGVKTKVIVNVKAEQAKNAGTANVVITQNRGAASQVLTSVFRNTNVNQHMNLNYGWVHTFGTNGYKGGFDNAKMTATHEIEMIIYAWSSDRLQVYTDSVLGKKSQAFYN